jgi:hypothetical protein
MILPKFRTFPPAAPAPHRLDHGHGFINQMLAADRTRQTKARF